MIVAFNTAVCASQGARHYQEDAAACWPGPAAAMPPFERSPEPGQLVAVLADGMGGHAAGALASQTVCSNFLSGFAHEAAGVRDRLRAGLTAANRALELKIESEPSLAGMGSTLIGAVFGPHGLHWISVGDSPLYLYRRGEVAPLNADHSLAPWLDQMVAEGALSAEQAKADPRRHMLRSAVTGEPLDLVDLSQQPLPLHPDDVVILASDGIHTIDAEQIGRLVTAFRKDGSGVLASALVREVESARDPHQDNVTVIVVQPAAA